MDSLTYRSFPADSSAPADDRLRCGAPRPFSWKSGLLALVFAVSAGGCSAGLKTNAPGTAGAGGSGTGSGGRGGQTGGGGGGSTGDAGSVGSGGSVQPPVDAAACQTADVMFIPKIPTVYLVVDRSGSMFHCLSSSELVCPNQADTSWSKLKDAIEMVLTQLDSQVRFGFTTIYGTNPAGGGSCPVLQGTLSDNVAPALNNAATIKMKYEMLPFPSPNTASQTGAKLESPASEALAAAANALTSDTTPGDKYMIFITDGQEDYCDDSIDICASDSTVWRLQAANAAGVRTIVFGLQTAQFNLPPGVLQSFANAGAGEPTVAPLHMNGTISDFYYQCNGGGASGGLWPMDMATAGKTLAAGNTLGTYSATAGPTMPHIPDASNETELISQLSTTLAGVKSCTFDLSQLKINLNKLNRASVLINGTTIQLDTGNNNGWDMTSQTELQLFGTACDLWHQSTSTDIQFNFPCDIIFT